MRSERFYVCQSGMQLDFYFYNGHYGVWLMDSLPSQEAEHLPTLYFKITEFIK